MNIPPCTHDRLIVFGRYPTPGTTKTRLIPILGPAGAADLQRRLTERTVAVARRSRHRTGARLMFCHDGGDARRLQRWLTGSDIDYIPQTGADLGRRMAGAIETAFGRGARRVVLVGTDVPGLTADRITDAFDALNRNDLVLGPSTDGGYWLIGLTTPMDLFAGIVWGRSDVLEKTRRLASRRHARVHLLAPLTDLDTPDDWRRTNGGRAALPPYLSVVIPTLDEASRIAGNLSATARPDVEIIVADGGSRDHTVALAVEEGARIVKAPQGRAAQQNRGAAVARGQVLLFLHADTRLPDDYVAHVFETLMDRRTVLGAFRFAADRSSAAMRWVALWTNLRARYLDLPYGDQALFLRRRDFFRVGGFPDVPIAEDLYLVRRMARRGRIVLAPAAVATSARRWQRLGVVRTTVINTLIAAGCLAGMNPRRLAPLYRPPRKTTMR